MAEGGAHTHRRIDRSAPTPFSANCLSRPAAPRVLHTRLLLCSFSLSLSLSLPSFLLRYPFQKPPQKSDSVAGIFTALVLPS